MPQFLFCSDSGHFPTTTPHSIAAKNEVHTVQHIFPQLTGLVPMPLHSLLHYSLLVHYVVPPNEAILHAVARDSNDSHCLKEGLTTTCTDILVRISNDIGVNPPVIGWVRKLG